MQRRCRIVSSNCVSPSLPNLAEKGPQGAKWPHMHRPIRWGQVHWIAFWAMISCWQADAALLKSRPLDTRRLLLHQHDNLSGELPASVPHSRSAGLVGFPAQHRPAVRTILSDPGMRRYSRTLLQAPLPGGGFQAKKYFTYVFFGATFFLLCTLSCVMMHMSCAHSCVGLLPCSFAYADVRFAKSRRY